MSKDEKFMMRAIELAKMGEGLTRPNPPVGAVLVLEDYIVAEGWHKKAGTDHAERDCLKKLPPIATNLKFATLYITLEPCSTHGRTPPCTDIILEKGIGRVVVSVVDLNPAHAGRGLKILEDAGVEKWAMHCAHSLHTPFWWLKCLVGPNRSDSASVNLYRRFLTWDIMKQPRGTRLLENLLNPILGKSIVVYLRKV